MCSISTVILLASVFDILSPHRICPWPYLIDVQKYLSSAVLKVLESVVSQTSTHSICFTLSALPPYISREPYVTISALLCSSCLMLDMDKWCSSGYGYQIGAFSVFLKFIGCFQNFVQFNFLFFTPTTSWGEWIDLCWNVELYCTQMLDILSLGDLKNGLGKGQSVIQICHSFYSAECYLAVLLAEYKWCNSI